MAGAVWIQNLFELEISIFLKQNLNSPMSQKVCSGMKQCVAFCVVFLGSCLICVNCEILLLLY